MTHPHASDSAGDPADLSRYSRQVLFAPIGEEGQRRLLASRVVVIGCGALGSALTDVMVRAGVGRVRVVDRDCVELSNLHRQVLFDEDDVAANLPKAEAARRKLSRINSQVKIEAVVADVNHRNIESLAEGADLLLDGTDNFETRFLINDLAVKTSRPWVYGACAAARGMSMPITPGQGPCLRCVFESAPPPELNPTCDTVGVLGPVAGLVASHQAMEALKILTGHLESLDRRLLSFDAWASRAVRLNVGQAGARGDCICCGRRQFEYLDGRYASSATALCGRTAVQVSPPEPGRLDLAVLAHKMRGVADAEPTFNAFVLKARVEALELTVFTDGRAIVKGTDRPEVARGVYARYIGS